MDPIIVMSALAQPTRLAVFSLLARAGEGGLSAGELAERTGTPSNTMSAHLTILSQAGLAKSRRAGRNIFYRAVPNAVRQLTVFFVKECCDGGSTVCDDLQADLDKCLAAREARSAAGKDRAEPTQ